MKPTNLPMVNHQYSDTGHDGIPQTKPVGNAYPFTAGAALNIGELVYLSAANTVNKSATAATVIAAPVGVVISGKDTDYAYPEAYTPSGVPAYQAAASGGQVLVQTDGLALVYCTGALAAGGTVIPGAAAGQVVAGSTAGSVIGFNVGAALAAAGWALIKLHYK